MTSTITTTNLNATIVKVGSATINSSGNSIVLQSADMVTVYESIQTASTSAAAVSLDYSLGALSIITLDANSNFTLNVSNINSESSTTVSNTLTLLIDCTTYLGYCNSINVNGFSGTLLFAGGSANIDITDATWVLQTISIIYNASGMVPSVILSSVVPFL
jgi:hypothetical protein